MEAYKGTTKQQYQSRQTGRADGKRLKNGGSWTLEDEEEEDEEVRRPRPRRI